jgi:hypothetical protein
MNPASDPWIRLTEAARRLPADGSVLAAPPGFATRVVALAFERGMDRPLLGLFDRFAWRALGLAGGLAVASVALNFSPAVKVFHTDIAAEQDPVAMVLELR